MLQKTLGLPRRKCDGCCTATSPNGGIGPRTSAAHARWEEIDLGDMAPVIELTKELIGAHLA